MKKKADEELGIILTREIQDMMFNESLTAEQRVTIFCSIVKGTPIEDSVISAFASALRTGYEYTNKAHRDSIYARRERQKNYQHVKRLSTKMCVDGQTSTEMNLRASTEMSVGLRALPKEGNGNGNGNIFPLNPPLGGTDDRVPPEVDVNALIADGIRNDAVELAERIEKTEAFAHMRVNTNKLVRCLISILKKNGAANPEIGSGVIGNDIIRGIESWTVGWKADGWQYAKDKITDWLYDEKWKQEPRKKNEPAVGAGCGECGVFVG